jgi:hypothetical protein
MSSLLRRVLLCTGLAAALVAVPVAGQSRTAGPTYSLEATIPIGLQPYTDLDVDPETGRVFLAVRDGMRVIDPGSGRREPLQTGLETSGTIEVGTNIDRIFAVIDDDYVGFIDLRGYGLDRAVEVDDPGRLVYEPSTQDLYVFSARHPTVRIFDGRTGQSRGTIELPGWGGDGILKTPGRIYVTVPPRKTLYAIETTDRVLREVPLESAPADMPRRFQLVANASGETLFLIDHYDLVAFDAASGRQLARITQRASILLYDDIADMLLVHASEIDWPQMKLIAFRLDDNELVRVSEQRLPQEGGLYPFPTPQGFVSGFFTGNVGPRDPTPFSRSYFTMWRRDTR